MLLSVIRDNQVYSTVRLASYYLENSLDYFATSRVSVLDTLDYQINDICYLHEHDYYSDVFVITGSEDNVIIMKNYLSLLNFDIPVSSFQTNDAVTQLRTIISNYFNSSLPQYNNFFTITQTSTSSIAFAYTIEDYVDRINLLELIKEFAKVGVFVQQSPLAFVNNAWGVDIVVFSNTTDLSGASVSPVSIYSSATYTNNIHIFTQERSRNWFNTLYIINESVVNMNNNNSGDVWYRDSDDNVSQSSSNLSIIVPSVFIKRSDDTNTNQMIANGYIPSSKYLHEITLDLNLNDNNLRGSIDVNRLKVGNAVNFKINNMVYTTYIYSVVMDSIQKNQISLQLGSISSSLANILI